MAVWNTLVYLNITKTFTTSHTPHTHFSTIFILLVAIKRDILALTNGSLKTISSPTTYENHYNKNEAALQTLPTSTLPEIVNSYHSLVPLDTSLEKVLECLATPPGSIKRVPMLTASFMPSEELKVLD